jgi:glutamine amidotransferase-like uncharacterized protein
VIGDALSRRRGRWCQAGRALVYRGPATLPGCSEAMAALLATSRWGFDVRYVGPEEELKLTARVLATASLYVQPGGGTLRKGYRHMKSHKSDIQEYVHAGGRYLGICLGGYLAGATPGFELLPGDTDRYVSSPGAEVATTKGTIVAVHWGTGTRHMYFEDGPYFWLHDGSEATVLATYPNGKIAALSAAYGSGCVAVVGPHPEADRSWYADFRLTNPDGIQFDLGHDLIDRAMTR